MVNSWHFARMIFLSLLINWFLIKRSVDYIPDILLMMKLAKGLRRQNSCEVAFTKALAGKSSTVPPKGSFS